MRPTLAAIILFLAAPAAAQSPPPQPTPEKPPEQAAPPEQPKPEPINAHPVELLRKEAAAVMNLVACDETKRFLIATSWLPVVGERTIYFNREKREALSEAEYTARSEEDRAGFVERKLPREYYYTTRYGSPLAYSRPLDILCKQIGGEYPFRQKRILDYGYGTIAHLRLLASLGADVVGVEVDPVLRALYSDPADTGRVEGAGLQPGPDGNLRLVHGSWPGNEAVKAAAGDGFDIVISKNTLKNGYINPAQPVEKRLLVDLGVPQQDFVNALAAALKPGGYLMIFNICPAQKPPGEGYIPWADGRCPFPREMLEQAGLDVLEYNLDDTAPVRAMARALEWDRGEQPMDLDHDLFAEYTLLRKRP